MIPVPTTAASEEVGRVVKDAIDAVRGETYDRAFELANGAILAGAGHPALLNVRATWFGQNGRYDEALADYEKVRASFPRDPRLLEAIGHCLTRLERWREAAAAFDALIAAAPTLARAHFRKGQVLEQLGQIEEMRRSHERAIEIQPDYADALAGLALAAVRQGDISTARIYGTRATAQDPRQVTANIVLAVVDIAEGNFEAAQRKLQTVPEDSQAVSDLRGNPALGLVGDAFDRCNRIADAFAAYSKLNERRRARHAETFETARDSRYVARMISYFERCSAWSAPRMPAPACDLPRSHVFLVGFVRTGTTLLEAVLASHPDVVALDETPCFPHDIQSLLNSDAGLDQLRALEDIHLASWQAAYWRSVQEAGVAVAGRVFLHKLPLHSLRLPMIATMFPEAKILFALRDPRDVVLSCFRNRFEMNPCSFEFLRLDDCARYYSGAMALVQLFRQKLPLDLREHRYEDIVADLASAVRSVCEFIGIDWSESMRNFRDAADSTINMRSISAPQVRRGLYQSAVGQWRRYQEPLAPILPILRPWVERFGYSLA